METLHWWRIKKDMLLDSPLRLSVRIKSLSSFMRYRKSFVESQVTLDRSSKTALQDFAPIKLRPSSIAA